MACDRECVLARRSEQWREVHPGVRWRGEVAEFVRLLDCVGRHCTCHTSRGCGAHQWLGAQRALDHLLYARGMREQFIDAEWNVGEAGHAGRPRDARRAARPRRLPDGKVALVVGAFAALALLMSFGWAWQASSSAPATPPLAAWSVR
jgi:hypothetical protein